MNSSDDQARRAYWAQQLQLGYDMIQQVLPLEVRECCEGLESIPDAAHSAGVEMLFSQSKIAGDIDRLFFIRRGLIPAVINIARDMNARGWILKIEDGYRTMEMQRQLGCKPNLFDAILDKCIWENGGLVPPVELVFRRAMVLIANLPKVGTHMSASAIDVSVFRRDDGSEVWRGNAYLEMSERTPMRSPFVDREHLSNRLEITAMMEAHGFVHFPQEFWHFNQGDAVGHHLRSLPLPARYGPVHWDPNSNRVTPYDDPLEPLNPLPRIQSEIEAAVARRQNLPSSQA